MAIKAVIFDLGETLVNFGRVNVNALLREATRLTYDYLHNVVSNARVLGNYDSYHRTNIVLLKWHYFWASVTSREFDALGMVERFLRRRGIVLEREQLEELAWLWYRPLGDKAYIESGLEKHLQELSEMSLELAIISNTFSPGLVLDRQLEKFGIKDFFPVRTYSSDTHFRKPDRRIFEATLKRLGIGPREAIMVGDKRREDVKGAQRVGIRPVYKRGAVNRNEKTPPGVAVIEHIAELPELIKQWNK